MPTDIQLKPDYYLDNFHRLIEHAQQWYGDFFTPSQQQWLKDFALLPHPAQCLLVRMLSRKGILFRSDKLSYVEIGDLSAPLDELARAKFVVASPALEWKSLAENLLTKPELLSLYPKLPRSLSKRALIEKLPDEPFRSFASLPFTVIALEHADIIQRLLVLFFANTYQDFSQFVLSDIGMQHFETYPLSHSLRFFTQPQQVDTLLALHAWQEQYQQLQPKTPEQLEHLLATLPSSTDHPLIERRRLHQINDIARDFERLEQYDRALTLFASNPLPPSRERQVRMLQKLKRNDQVQPLLRAMCQEPYDIAEYEIAQKLNQRFGDGSVNIKNHPKPHYQVEHIELDLTHQRVEFASKDWLQAQGYEVYYSENHLLNGLLGLAFWPEIFHPVEGAFVNQYQLGPLDLFRPEFVTRRAELIQNRLAQLRSGGLHTLLERYDKKYGISNALVQWRYLPRSLVELAIEIIGADTLLTLFAIQLSDLKHFRNGMPDLIAFKDGKFEWIEVKGPGDKLQVNQLRWIAQCNQHNIEIKVLHVAQLTGDPDT